MDRVARQLLKLALRDRGFARQLVAGLRDRPEFRQFVDGRRFRNPDTGNKVLYDSLPDPEQRRVYLEWWRGRRRQDETAKRDPKKLQETRLKVEESNPWAVPLWEYYDRVQEGAGKKWHAEDDIPTQTVEDLEWMGPPGDKVKIGDKDFRGTEVSFYRSVEPLQYVKRNDDGDIERDPETGKATYLSEEEMRKEGLPLFETTVSAYVDDTPIGSVANEWGATLVQVAEEHQKKGIGKFLSKLWRKAYPFRTSGGFTEKGLSTFKRVHQDFVLEALEKGEYKRALEEGWMEPARFVEILQSAGLDPSGKPSGKPSIERPDNSGSPELRKIRKELADVSEIQRRMDWDDDHDYSEAEIEENRRKLKKILQEAMRLEDEERSQREDQAKSREKEMQELASRYWKAKQDGNTELASKIWDQMGDL